jgi:AcrR family transcriptional regulator
MGITERRERERLERKALIMRCAKELILELGAEKVSMMEIAKRAELSKATLYLYFSSKDVLFKEICDTAGNHFFEVLKARMKPGLSAMDIIQLYWNCYLEMFGESDEIIIIFSMKHFLAPDYPFISLDDESDSLTAFEFYSTLKMMISQGIAEGTFNPDMDPGLISRTILSIFSNIVENAARLPKSDRHRQIIREMQNIFQVVLRGIVREGFDKSLLVFPAPKETETVSLQRK